MKILFSIFTSLFILSCSHIDFIYSDNKNLTNQLYNNTNVEIQGIDVPYINTYVPLLFGGGINKVFDLLITIEEEKIKSSVEKNQATSNLKYELRFNYTLNSIEKDCLIYQKELLSSFYILPKSSGYDFGTDASLEKKYELAINENLNRFVSLSSGADLDNCK